jgi:hypothetical protein
LHVQVPEAVGAESVEALGAPRIATGEPGGVERGPEGEVAGAVDVGGEHAPAATIGSIPVTPAPTSPPWAKKRS